MIPGLDADPVTHERIESAFATWAEHFRRNLKEGGLSWLLSRYQELVRSVETQTCDHGAGLNTGDEWRRCCGYQHEYTNDLAVRDALETIVETVGIERLGTIASEVKELDDRLYSLYEHRPVRTGHWWHQGLPKGVG